MEWTDYFRIGIFQAVITAIVWYFASYIKEKGKNLATKEDVDEITDKIESVKTTYAQKIEGLKSQLNAKFHAQTVRFEKEFKVYEEVWGALLELRNATVHLRIAGKEDPDERMNRYRKAFDNFYPVLYGSKPFIPQEIFSSLEDLLRVIFSEASNQQRLASEGNLPDKIWIEMMDRSEHNIELILEKVDIACEYIRQAIKNS